MSQFRPSFNTLPRGAFIEPSRSNIFNSLAGLVSTVTEGASNIAALNAQRQETKNRLAQRSKTALYNSLLPEIARLRGEAARTQDYTELRTYLEPYIGTDVLPPEYEAELVKIRETTFTEDFLAAELAAQTMNKQLEEFKEAQRKESFLLRKSSLEDDVAELKRQVGTPEFATSKSRFFEKFETIVNSSDITVEELIQLQDLRRTVEDSDFRNVATNRDKREELSRNLGQASLDALISVLIQDDTFINELSQEVDPSARFSQTYSSVMREFETYIEENYPDISDQIISAMANSPTFTQNMVDAVQSVYGAVNTQIKEVNEAAKRVEEEISINNLFKTALKNPVDYVTSLLNATKSTKMSTLFGAVNSQVTALATTVANNENFTVPERIASLQKLKGQVENLQSSLVRPDGNVLFPPEAANKIQAIINSLDTSYKELDTFSKIADNTKILTAPIEMVPNLINRMFIEAVQSPTGIVATDVANYMTNLIGNGNQRSFLVAANMFRVSSPHIKAVFLGELPPADQYALKQLLPEINQTAPTTMTVGTSFYERFLELRSEWDAYSTALINPAEVTGLDKRISPEKLMRSFVGNDQNKDQFISNLKNDVSVKSVTSHYLAKALSLTEDGLATKRIPNEAYTTAKNLMEADGYYIRNDNGTPRVIYDPYTHTLSAALRQSPELEKMGRDELRDAILQSTNPDLIQTVRDRFGEIPGYGRNTTLESTLFDILIRSNPNIVTDPDALRPFITFEFVEDQSESMGLLSDAAGGFVVRPTLKAGADPSDPVIERIANLGALRRPDTGTMVPLSFSRDLANYLMDESFTTPDGLTGLDRMFQGMNFGALAQ